MLEDNIQFFVPEDSKSFEATEGNKSLPTAQGMKKDIPKKRGARASRSLSVRDFEGNDIDVEDRIESPSIHRIDESQTLRRLQHKSRARVKLRHSSEEGNNQVEAKIAHLNVRYEEGLHNENRCVS